MTPSRVSIQEAILRAGASRSTIYRLRRSGLLVSYRARGVDARVYVDLDRLQELRRQPSRTRGTSRRKAIIDAVANQNALGVPLGGLSEEERKMLFRTAELCSYAPGNTVFHAGEPADSLHVVLRGRLAVVVQGEGGRETMISVVGEKEIVGELALFIKDARRSATVRALESTETLAIRRHDFQYMRRRHPRISDAFVEILTERVVRLSAQLDEARYVPVRTRIMRRLVELAMSYGQGRAPAAIPLTQTEIADLIGVVRVTVNRFLVAEQRKGTVRLRRGKITVLDLDSLVRRSQIGGPTVDVRTGR